MQMCVCTDVDPQAEQVVHGAAHATGGGCMERSVCFFVLAVHLCSTGHQQLHHLQVTWNRDERGGGMIWGTYHSRPVHFTMYYLGRGQLGTWKHMESFKHAPGSIFYIFFLKSFFGLSILSFYFFVYSVCTIFDLSLYILGEGPLLSCYTCFHLYISFGFFPF